MVWFKRLFLRFIALPLLRSGWPVERHPWPASTTHGYLHCETLRRAQPSYTGPLCLATLQNGSSGSNGSGSSGSPECKSF
eukprot:7397272-Alexandrium_andersonii.AAC.1